MNASFAAPTQTRIAAFAAAILTSTVVLGATVLGMQSGAQSADLQVSSPALLAHSFGGTVRR